MGAVIKAIDAGSPACKKLRIGDELIAVFGNEIADVLDYKYYTYDGELTLTLRDCAGKFRLVHVSKQEGEELGLTFETYLMDKARACSNRCLFCFVDQLPRGLRKSLYFKDDDARLSFLTGSYITLTNLSEREISRIISLKISPINVSVHATDGALRARLLGNPAAADGYNILKRLAENSITSNCQIVCCPGINDGLALSRTMSDLAELYPYVNSVSVVPVGLTKRRAGLYPLVGYDKPGAEKTVSQVEAYADICRQKYGSRIFFCADELYIKAQKTLPDDAYYEGYPQLENGVGMITLFREEFLAALEAACKRNGSGGAHTKKYSPFSVVTGVAAAPYITELLELADKQLGGLDYAVYPVKNKFFGESIDVAGLITGHEIITSLMGKDPKGRMLIPKTMLRHGEGVFLDDVTVDDVEIALGVPVIAVGPDGGAFLREIIDNSLR